MQKYSDVVLDKNGNGVGGLTITVKTYPDGQPATIYAYEGGPAVASVKTDASGRFSFYAANGKYKGYGAGAGVASAEFGEITLFDPKDADAAAIITAKADDPFAVARSVLDRLNESVSLFDFDPLLGTAGHDDAPAIQLYDNYCAAKGKIARAPGITLTLKTPVKIKAPWRGIDGKSEWVIASDFAYNPAIGQGIGAIVNKNFTLAYSDATADYFYFVGINVRLEQNTKDSGSAILLANVKGGAIENVNIKTNNTTRVCGSLLDAYACVKNVAVRGSSFANLTQAAAGGGAVWVRNITTDGSNTDNVTENITFDPQCSFTTTTVDEAIAVYGVRGKTRNIRVFGKAIGAPSPVKHGTLVSVFPLNDGSLIGGVNYAAVEDVTVTVDVPMADNFNDHVIRVGATADVAQRCENIKVLNCNVNMKQSAVRTSYGIRIIKCVGDGLVVEGCHVDATGSPQVVTYGISGADMLTRSTTTGNLSYAVDSCKLVEGNPSLGGTSGTFNCRNVRNNRIFVTSLGVVHNDSSTTSITNNYIELTSTGTAGIFYNTLGNATTPASEAIGNLISMANASGFAMQVNGSAPGKIRALNNKVIGTGKTISGKFTQIAGNDWYGKLDAMRTAAYLDYDHNYATPIGTFAAIDVPVMGTTRLQTGWVKTANAGVGADWKAVYMETASN